MGHGEKKATVDSQAKKVFDPSAIPKPSVAIGFPPFFEPSSLPSLIIPFDNGDDSNDNGNHRVMLGRTSTVTIIMRMVTIVVSMMVKIRTITRMMIRMMLMTGHGGYVRESSNSPMENHGVAECMVCSRFSPPRAVDVLKI